MNFQKIPPVSDSKTYLDIAFRQARKEAGKKLSGKGRIERRRKLADQQRFSVAAKTLEGNLKSIIDSFPDIDNLMPFYNELIKCTLDYRKLKKSLGAVDWAMKMIKSLYKKYKNRYKSKGEYYGRLSSVMKQIDDNLKYLIEARKVMRTYPTIKDMKTAALFGFPNVGKTTIMTKITEATPEIGAYPFTTREINIGYAKESYKKVQLVDTPGTLNRFQKMNNIEKQAYLVIKYVADAIIYVFDLTEPYPLEHQKALYKRAQKFEKPVKIYLSKTDLLTEQDIDNFKENYECLTTVEELKNYLFSI